MVLYPENAIDYVERYILTDYSLLPSLEFDPHSNAFLQDKVRTEKLRNPISARSFQIGLERPQIWIPGVLPVSSKMPFDLIYNAAHAPGCHKLKQQDSQGCFQAAEFPVDGRYRCSAGNV